MHSFSDSPSSDLTRFLRGSGGFFHTWHERCSRRAASHAAAPIRPFGAAACHCAATTGGADQTHPAEGARNEAGFDQPRLTVAVGMIMCNCDAIM